MRAANGSWNAKVSMVATLAVMMAITGAPAAGQLPPKPPVCPAPAAGTTWSTRTLGSTANEQASGVAVDLPRCGVYLAGDTLGTVGAASAGSSDAVIARFDTAGGLTWTVQFGSSGSDYVDDVGVDGDGDVYVLGHTHGTLPGSPIINLGGSDLFLVKLDRDGVVLWTRMLGSAGSDVPTGLAIASTGDVYVTGFTDGLLTGASAGAQDYFLGRYDPDGNLVMLVQAGSAGNDRAKAVAVGPGDNAYIVGDTDGDLEGVQAGNADLFVAKYDSAGVQLWIDQRGTSDLELGADIAVNDDQQVFVVGSTALGLDGNVSAGAMDIVLLRYSTWGTWQFTEQRGSSSTDLATGVGLTTRGAPVVAGTTSGTLDGFVPAGSSDAFVMKFGKAGAWGWTRLGGGTATDYGVDVGVDGRDHVYLAGEYGGSIGGIPSAGLTDMFAASWDGAGTAR